MTDNNVFIEQRIITAVRELLTGKVNDILRESEFAIPVVEFGDYGCMYSVAPAISLSACEQTEKERIIRLDSYTLTISFTFIETPESEMYCYAYAGAVGRAVYDDPTLGGVADRAVITGKKYLSPKKPHCGDDWELIVSLKVTVEEMKV